MYFLISAAKNNIETQFSCTAYACRHAAHDAHDAHAARELEHSAANLTFLRFTIKSRGDIMYPFPDRSMLDEDYDMNSVSGCDCTGLIPAAVTNPGEFDSYEELYEFLPPVPPHDDRD